MIKQGYKKTAVGVIPEEWEVKRLRTQAEVDKENISSTYEGEFINYVSLSDIENGKIFPQKIEFKLAPSRAKRITKRGDVLLATVRPNLKNFAIVDSDNIIASTGFSVLGQKVMDLKFLYFFLFSQIAEKQYHSLIVGSNYPALNSDDVKNLKLPVPPLPEQKAIADCLSIWDKAIEKQTQLIEAKKQFKKGLMQGFFNGQLTVENGQIIKAKEGEDFTKDWEEVSLRKVGKFFKGKGVPKDEISATGDYKCLTYGDLYTKYDYLIKDVKSFISDKVAEESQEIKYGDICFAASGETLEDIGKCAVFIDERTGYAGGDIIVFRPKNIDSIFLSYYLNSDDVKRQLRKFGQGHSVVHVYSSQLEKLRVKLPPIDLQKAVSNLLLVVRKEIELQEKKLGKLQLQKKGLMQVLLTGERRLIKN